MLSAIAYSYSTRSISVTLEVVDKEGELVDKEEGLPLHFLLVAFLVIVGVGILSYLKVYRKH